METQNTPTSDRLLNVTATKRYALAVSKARRNGKFTRVGESFIIATESAIEAKLRGLFDESRVAELTPTDLKFITGTVKKKAADKFELLARSIIHAKVMAHPTLGRTLLD